MSLRQKYLRILSGLAPAGAAGVTLLLGSAAPGLASPEPARFEPPAAAPAPIGERLAAIRDATSSLAADRAAASAKPADKLRLAWGNWWNNWGWRPWWGCGWPNWNNWHNWRNWPNWWRNW